MKVLKLNQQLFKWIGVADPNVLTSQSASTILKIAYFGNLVSAVALVVPALTFAFRHLEDVADSTDALYFVGILGMTIAKLVFYTKHTKDIFQLIADFQRVINAGELFDLI